MARLLIQPVADETAERNRGKTLNREVSFGEEPYRSALTAEQHARLDELHPGGMAAFWGTRAFLDDDMRRVKLGDVVLFTWKGHLRAIGEVGVSFRNEPFAEALWKEDGDQHTYVNVYSLIALDRTVLIPYRTLATASRGKLRGPFRRGAVVHDEDFVAEVVGRLGVELSTTAPDETSNGRRSVGVEGELERLLTPELTYSRSAATIRVQRAESLLVHEYVRANPDSVYTRVTSESGISDMYTVHAGGAEVVEAKGGAGRERVRQAVAQLLHYAPLCPHPVDRLTALFPERPARVDVELLHSVGVDCVYRVGPSTFHRDRAPEARRAHMRPVWNDAIPR
ncbi:hypothetical protein [Saccharothrix obliqua]|uniref:hypothetical protein n=1 Tax=Saccharothrix obliqua TaxID=2861747 RepID=UPI001C5DD683|nr:hypothetical protein [Saccharothrix obliqua]MBW4719958.1 hypothetical protein [Saccharothrix obliqua]